MTSGRLLRFFLVRLLPLVILGLLARHTMAQADPPGRVARLNLSQGPVVFSPAGDNEWTDAVANRPLTRGDRIWTDRGSRAEVQVGSSAVRLDGQSHLEILVLDDQSAQLSVTQGTVYVRVRSLPEGENFEIDTPNVAYRAAYPGDYRIDVDPAHGTTRVTIHSGTGAVYGENGQALPLGGGQQITFKGRSLAQVSAKEAPPQDGFDRWAAERNRQEDQAISARFVPREVVGYQQLDAHGKWAHDLTHGMVWFPQRTVENWAPYRHGYWEWISPWGWTWIDDAPWGFAPFHYGRWTMLESRWAWVPGRLGLRPVYAPALVAFIGGTSGVNWDLTLGGGKPGVAWFPLAPGEAWQPGYRASPVYISNVNRNIAVPSNAGYSYQRSAEALTAISAEDFHRGKPARAGWLRLAANFLTNAQVVPPPPKPENGQNIAQQRATPARVLPPPAAEIRQVIATATPASAAEVPALSRREREAAQREVIRRQAEEQAQAKAAQAQERALAKAAQAQAQRLADADRLRQAAEQENARREKAQRAKEPKRDEAVAAAQAPADSHVPPAEAAKPVQPAVAVVPTPAAEQAQRVEQARAKEQAQRAEQARAKEQAQRAKEQAQRVEQARAKEQQAQRVEQARVKEQAQRVEQARAKEQAQRAEQARAKEQVQRVEQARVKEQAQRAEQARAKEQAQRAEQARVKEQAKREQAAARTEQARREQQSSALNAKREQALRAVQAKREQIAARTEQARRDQATRRAEQAKQQQLARRESVKREQLARRESEARRDAQAKRDEQLRREAHAKRVEQARRTAEREAQALRVQREEQARAAAEREAQALREQRAEREAQARRDAEERQQAQREAWQRQQQALAEQWRREHQQWEQQQRNQGRRRPELRPEPRDDRVPGAPAPEVWQRGIPILNPGRTS